MIADCYDVFCQIVTELSVMKLDARIHWYQHQACKAYIGLLLSCMKRSHISDTNLLYTSAPSYVSVEGGRELKNLFQFDVDVYINFWSEGSSPCFPVLFIFVPFFCCTESILSTGDRNLLSSRSSVYITRPSTSNFCPWPNQYFDWISVWLEWGRQS